MPAGGRPGVLKPARRVKYPHIRERCMAVSMNVTKEGIHIFRVRGKLLANSMDELKAKLDAAGEKACVVVNLKGAHLADSMAVGYLVRRHGILKRGGGTLALCGLHANVSKLLAMAGLNTHFAVYDREEDAVEGLKTVFAAQLPPPKKRGRKPKDAGAGRP